LPNSHRTHKKKRNEGKKGRYEGDERTNVKKPA
jgi:hypothetical protein